MSNDSELKALEEIIADEDCRCVLEDIPHPEEDAALLGATAFGWALEVARRRNPREVRDALARLRRALVSETA